MVDKLVTKVKYELIAETSKMLRAGLSVVRLVTVTGNETAGGNEINEACPVRRGRKVTLILSVCGMPLPRFALG